jgi:hypothetical protein
MRSETVTRCFVASRGTIIPLTLKGKVMQLGLSGHVQIVEFGHDLVLYVLTSGDYVTEWSALATWIRDRTLNGEDERIAKTVHYDLVQTIEHVMKEDDHVELTPLGKELVLSGTKTCVAELLLRVFERLQGEARVMPRRIQRF